MTAAPSPELGRGGTCVAPRRRPPLLLVDEMLNSYTPARAVRQRAKVFRAPGDPGADFAAEIKEAALMRASAWWLRRQALLRGRWPRAPNRLPKATAAAEGDLR